jgi:sugar/nucleoside kinase (ribokinase family)
LTPRLTPKTTDVIVAGEIFADLIMSGFPAWPQPGTEAFASEFRREVGGGAAITANGLARLGSRAAVLSVLGCDGEWIVEKLNQLGVLTSQLQFDPLDSTPVTVAISTPEDRTFLTYPGSNRMLPGKLRDAASSGALASARHIHLGWAPDLNLATELLTEIRGNGCSISLDVGWHEAWLADSRSMKLMPALDIFFPNEPEALRMTGERDPERSLRLFETAGAKRVALKLGTGGAALLWDGEIFRVDPYPVNTVDTIGAGDCFDAGFLHFWLQGAPPLTCLRAANFCGAASTEAYGGIAGFPDLTRVGQALTN